LLTVHHEKDEPFRVEGEENTFRVVKLIARTLACAAKEFTVVYSDVEDALSVSYMLGLDYGIMTK